MSNYYASHRVNGYNDLLNRRLGVYYRGLVPRLLGVSGYDQKTWIRPVPSSANDWGTKKPIPDKVPPLMAEKEVPPT
jgi:hypothetical protein